jgi:hypothetical protein
MFKKITLLLTVALLTVLLVGCGGATEEPEAEMGEVALELTGNVENEMAWTEAELEAMDTMTVEVENRDGEMEEYTGVSMNALLEEAGAGSDASTINLVASDGYTADVPLAEVQGCDDCIVAFDDGLRSVLPGFPGNKQVKGLIEIQVE